MRTMLERWIRPSGRVLAAGIAILAGGGSASGDDGQATDLEGCGRAVQMAPSRGKGAFDPASGADNRNWPPDPLVEFKHLKLEIDLVDMDQARFDGVATYTVAPIGVPLSGLTLDCEGLEVKSVRWAGDGGNRGVEVEYFQDGSRLSMRFGAQLPEGPSLIEIRYAGERPIAGLIFTPSHSGEFARAAEVHSQGQAESNHHWFPCHDSPNVRVPIDLLITAPKGMTVSGNGALVERRAIPISGSSASAGGVQERELWHWRQEKPIVPYLVAIVAGQFELVPLAAPETGVPMAVWVPPGREGDVERTYGNTDRMIALFERVFGQEYPWARYDQIVVRNFGAGGMENVSATTLHPGAIFDEVAGQEEDLDGLIAHELCHQWTGDLVTCRSWAHIWLNEGWATYGSALWFEERDGEVGYFDSMLGSMEVAKRDSTDGPLPMVSPIYKNPWETFSRAGNPYPKGSSILHMLRERLGEEVFIKGVHRYMAAHAGGLAETDDFRKALEAESGLSLEWFFDQWCLRPGCPQLAVSTEYDAEQRQLRVRAEQTQKIDERTPAFRLTLPIFVETELGGRIVPWEFSERVAETSIELDGPPTLIAVDPRLTSLKTMELSMPTDLLIACALRGPTHAARRTALAALSSRAEPAVIRTLIEIAGAPGTARSSRLDAIRSLEGFGTEESLAALLTLFDANETDPRVRTRLVEMLAKLPKDDAAERLERVALHDRSYTCRAAAARGLASVKALDRVETLLTLSETPSHQERVREAALGALADLDDVRVVELALSLARRGNFDRARPGAIAVLGRMAGKATPEMRERVVQELVAMLDDPERRTREAAGDALSAMKASEALTRLDAMAGSDRDPSQRDRATKWASAIRDAEAPAQKP